MLTKHMRERVASKKITLQNPKYIPNVLVFFPPPHLFIVLCTHLLTWCQKELFLGFVCLLALGLCLVLVFFRRLVLVFLFCFGWFVLLFNLTQTNPPHTTNHSGYKTENPAVLKPSPVPAYAHLGLSLDTLWSAQASGHSGPTCSSRGALGRCWGWGRWQPGCWPHGCLAKAVRCRSPCKSHRWAESQTGYSFPLDVYIELLNFT